MKSDKAELLVHKGYQRYCAICGKCWIAKRKDAVYCTPRCRQTACRGSNPVLVRHKIEEDTPDET